MSRWIICCLGMISVFSATLSAQNTTATRIGIVNSSRFEDPNMGIVRLMKTLDAVRVEFNSDRDSLSFRRFQTITDEIEKLRTQPELASALDAKSLLAKLNEAEKLKREIMASQEEEKLRFEKRFLQVVRPVMDDISKALSEFAKQNHFTVMVDISKLDCLLVASEQDKIDVTRDFITFYNTKWVSTTTAK